MAETLTGELKEALLNNTYDHEHMVHSMIKTWENSYSYLYGYQEDLVGYKYFHYMFTDITAHQPSKNGKFYLNKTNDVLLNIGYDIIHVCDREEYRKSKFYMNFFTLNDIINNYKIFKKMPIILIDNKVIWDFKMKLDMDCIMFQFPFKRRFIIQKERNPITGEEVYIDHDIKVLFVDTTYYQTVVNNKNMLYFDTEDRSIRVYKNLLNKINFNHGMLMCSLNFNDGYYPQLGTCLLEVDDVSESFYKIRFTDSIYSKVVSYSGNITVNLVWINNLYKHTYYTGSSINEADSDGAKLDLTILQREELTPYTMPIPTCDILLFKKAFNQDQFDIVDPTVTLHYPNIYEINANTTKGDEYMVYYFYKENNDVGYSCMFDFYFRFLCNKFGMEYEKVINQIYKNNLDLTDLTEEEVSTFNKVFKKIIDYNHYIYKYGETDFLYNYLETSQTADKTALEYKIYKMREWVKQNPFMLRDYVLEQNDICSHTYHLWASTINLENRIRNNTANEFDDGRTIYEFDEPMYVFAFRNDLAYPEKIECRIFVDGLIAMNAYQDRKITLDYIYIPVSQIKEDSYIEIEVFDSYSFTTTVNFSSLDDEKVITIVEPNTNMTPTLSDLILYDEEDEAYYNAGTDIKVTCSYTQGDAEAITTDSNKPVVFTRLTKFILSPTDEIFLNKDISVKIYKNSKGMDYILARSCTPYLLCETPYFKYDKEYIRLFKNGKLIPTCRWRLFSSGNIPRVSLNEFFNKNDFLYIDIAPYRYKVVYYQEEITIDHPVINLSGYINKPFDIRYYDVYLNGRKLSMNNIVAISPYEITLFNIKSRYQLEIFEKDRDYEYFGVDYTNNLFYFSPKDLMESNFMKQEDIYLLIDDIINHVKDEHVIIKGNTDEEEPLDRTPYDDYQYALLFYDNDIIPKTFLNPDRKQFNDLQLKEEYTLIYDNYLVIPSEIANSDIEKSRRRKYPSVLSLNPDEYIEGQTTTTLASFMIGNPDEEDMEEILSSTPEFIMENEPNIERSK